VPLDRWLRGELRDVADAALGALEGLVDEPGARDLRDRHLAGRDELGPQLYALVMLGLWRDGLRTRRAQPLAKTRVSASNRSPSILLSYSG